MYALASLVYILLCLFISSIAVRRLITVHEHADGVFRCLTFITVFSTTFFGGFYVLGLVELIVSRPIVSPGYAVIVAGVGLIVVARWVRATRPPAIDDAWPVAAPAERPLTRLGRTILLATIIVFAGVAVMATSGFPVGFEARHYHLPIALHIFQAASLKVWDVAFPLTLAANASVYYGFLLWAIPERLVSVADMPFLIPLSIAIYGLGRITGADKTASVFAAVGVLTIPIVDFGATVAEADIGGAAFVAMALYFAIVPGHARLSYRVLSGLAAGLAFGFKLYHIVTIVFLGALIVVESAMASRPSDKDHGLRSGAIALLVFLGAAFATAGFWLIRNYVQLGNPFYPWHLPVFDLVGWVKPTDVPPAMYANAERWWVHAPREWFVYPWLEGPGPAGRFDSQTGLGAFFAAAVPVSCLATLIGILNGAPKTRRTLAILLGGGTLVLLGWAAAPRQLRYAIGALVFLAPLVAWTMSQLQRQSRRIFEYLLTACICSMLLVLLSQQLVEFSRQIMYSRYFISRREAYRYPALVDRLPPGSTVVNAGGQVWNYPLFGEGYRNRVVTFEEAIRAMSDVKPPCYFPATCQSGRLIMDMRAVRRIGATHVFTIGGTSGIVLRGCVTLKEVDRFDDAYMQRSLMLYKVIECDDDQGS